VVGVKLWKSRVLFVKVGAELWRSGVLYVELE